MNESEQVQAIAEINAMIENWAAYSIGSFVNACENLRDIVDSQAQKIEQQQAEISVQRTMLNDMNELVAEQAKEIERLKQTTRGIKNI